MFPIKSLIRGVNAVHLNKFWQNTGVAQCAFSTKKLQLEIPPKPKRPLSPFFLYMFENRTKFCSENPDLKAMQVSQAIAKNWRELDANKKSPYIQAYEKEKQKYALEITKYNSLLTPEMKQTLKEAREKAAEARARRVIRARNKDLGKPKRAVTGYFCFLEHIRTVEPRKPNEMVTEYMKRMSEKWKKLSDEQKKAYYDEAHKRHEQYRIELQKWEQRMIKEGNLDLVKDPFPKKTTTKKSPRGRPKSQ